MSEQLRAFTTQNTKIVNRLINLSKVISENNTVSARTLWDTGATISCVSHNIIHTLKLAATGNKDISTPSGSKIVDTFLVDLELPNNILLKDVVVCETEIGNQGIDLLIGMDIINKGDFSVSNYLGKTYFSFSIPSMKTIDFAKKITVRNKLNANHKHKKKHK